MTTEELVALVKNAGIYESYIMEKTPVGYNKTKLKLWRRTYAAVESEWDFVCDLNWDQWAELKKLGV